MKIIYVITDLYSGDTEIMLCKLLSRMSQGALTMSRESPFFTLLGSRKKMVEESPSVLTA